MSYAFDRFLFFDTSLEDRKSIARLCEMHPRLNHQTIAFPDHAGDLAHTGEKDLLITGNRAADPFRKDTRFFSNAARIALSDFEIHCARITQLKFSNIFGDVVLAFLPEHTSRISRSLFSLFGFQPIVAENTQSLLRALKNGAGIVVFDQDMPGHTSRLTESREKIFSLLRAHKIQHKNFAVILIKDFEQGSLFGDMSSQARDIANALLSPEEYNYFIYQYLIDFQFAHAIKLMRAQMHPQFGLIKYSKPNDISAITGLQDIKCAFTHSQSDDYAVYTKQREHALLELQDLHLRQMLTAHFISAPNEPTISLIKEATHIVENFSQKILFPRVNEDARESGFV